MVHYYIRPKRKMHLSKRRIRFESKLEYQLQHDCGEVEVEVAGYAARNSIIFCWITFLW